MQQNIDMRKISAWVAIAAVPTAMAGIYGMNFDYMPELHWTWGYPAVLLVMVVVCALLYRDVPAQPLALARLRGSLGHRCAGPARRRRPAATPPAWRRRP